MAPRPPGTRDRMLDSARVILSTRGVAGVTVDAVLAHSGAPRGSVYHHFPGGRDQLLLETLEGSGAYITARLQRSVTRADVRTALQAFITFWKTALTESGFTAGCPVAAAAMDGDLGLAGAQETVRDVFETWDTILRSALREAGCPQPRIPSLSATIVAAVEGAIILCRARHDLAPLHAVGHELDALLSTVLSQGESHDH